MAPHGFYEAAVNHGGGDWDVIVNLQCDEPLINPADLWNLLAVCETQPDSNVGLHTHARRPERKYGYKLSRTLSAVTGSPDLMLMVWVTTREFMLLDNMPLNQLQPLRLRFCHKWKIWNNCLGCSGG